MQPEGTGSLGVCIVGESPGSQEVQDGLPFRPWAPAGSVLNRAIKQAGFDRSQFLFTNLAFCQPPGNKLERQWYERGALDHCRVHLDEVVRKFKPKVFLALGNLPLRELTGYTGKKRNIGYMRGFVLPGTRYPGLVVGSFHPSFLRRGAMHLLRILVGDIKRAVAVAQGQFTDFELSPKVPRGFNLTPSLEDARAYVRRIRDNPNMLVYYDIETHESLNMDEAELFTFTKEGRNPWDIEEPDEDENPEDTWLQDRIDRLLVDAPITQFQMSTEENEAICFPWTSEFARCAKEAMERENPKVGHNNKGFDEKVLRIAGIEVRGRSYDTLLAYHHAKPDAPAHLQHVAQQFGARFPWKHFADSSEQFAFYGCLDTANLIPIWNHLPEHMKAIKAPGPYSVSLWDGYQRHVLDTHEILREVSRRGIPINDEARVAFGVELDEMMARVDGEIQKLHPDELKNCNPKAGFVREPKDTTGMVQRTFEAQVATVEEITQECTCKKKCKKCGGRRLVTKQVKTGAKHTEKVTRWCELLPFKPSSDQVLRYIRHRGHPVPKNPAGKGEDKNKPYTGKAGIEQLFKKTNDPFYGKMLEYRAIQKQRTTYVEGWAPAADGRVHPTFVFSTASMQLGSKRPNCQNVGGSRGGNLALKFRRCIQAEKDRIFYERDFSGLHAFMVGWLARDPSFCRLSKLGIHDYVTSKLLEETLEARLAEAEKALRKKASDKTVSDLEILKQTRQHLVDLDSWLSLSDEELAKKLGWIKSNHKFLRNIVKQGVHGANFGVSASGLQKRYPEYFKKTGEAQLVLDVLTKTFPIVDQWKKDVLVQANLGEKRLVTPYGANRYFYDIVDRREVKEDYIPRWNEKLIRNRHNGKLYAEGQGMDAEKAIAYLPSACSHQYVRDAMDLIHKAGLDERFRMINQVHDSLVFEPLESELEECDEAVRPLMEHHSRCLRDDVLAPDGLVCYTEASWGYNWAPQDPKREWSEDGNPGGMRGL